MPLFMRVQLHRIRAQPDALAPLDDVNLIILTFPTEVRVRDCAVPRPPGGSGVEALIPWVTLFGRGAFEETITVN